jgi:hypothetical protein
MTEAMQRYRRSLSFRAKREILLDIRPFLQIDARCIDAHEPLPRFAAD